MKATNCVGSAVGSVNLSCNTRKTFFSLSFVIFGSCPSVRCRSPVILQHPLRIAYTRNWHLRIVSSRDRLASTLNLSHEFPRPNQTMRHLRQAPDGEPSSVLFPPLCRCRPAPLAFGCVCGAGVRGR